MNADWALKRGSVSKGSPYEHNLCTTAWTRGGTSLLGLEGGLYGSGDERTDCSIPLTATMDASEQLFLEDLVVSFASRS